MAGENVLKIFNWKRILLPVIIGLSGATYLLWSGFDVEAFKQVQWNLTTVFWISVACLMMVIRDLSYMYRIRVLTDNGISWRNSFDVVMLWEFASALTPSVVGGSGVAMYIVHKEGISIGRSTAVVMLTAILDELFYILMVPIIILFVGFKNLFPISLEESFFGIRMGTIAIFVVGYFFILILTSLLIYATFIHPRGFKSTLLWVFKLKWIRRWRYTAIQVGDDIMTSSIEFKGKPWSFWLKSFGATFFSWTARFWVVNFIILAFLPVSDHLLVYGRQLVMWVIMLISPTPGSSGIAELAFSGFLGEFTVGLAATFALLWRIISYYPYLFIGSIVLPTWLRRVFANERQ